MNKKNMNISTWIDENLILDPTSNTPFGVIFDKYNQEILENRIVPYSKIQFSRGLRDKLKVYIQNDQVCIVNRKRLIIKGVKLKK